MLLTDTEALSSMYRHNNLVDYITDSLRRYNLVSDITDLVYDTTDIVYDITDIVHDITDLVFDITT